METKSDIILLTEIGDRNLSNVECLSHNYEFHYISPENNMFCGVGIHINDNINGVQVIGDFTITKTCNCKKCETESLSVGFSYQNIEYVLGGVYRHPNDNTKHLLYDLETTLEKIGDKATVILAGDINIDLIKFNNYDVISLFTIHSTPHMPDRLFCNLYQTYFCEIFNK